LMGNFVKTLLTDESFEIDNITNLVESKSMWEIIDILDYLNANINVIWYEELFEMIMSFFFTTHNWVATMLDVNIRDNSINTFLNNKKAVIIKLRELNNQLKLSWWNPLEIAKTSGLIKNSVRDIQLTTSWVWNIDNAGWVFSKDLDLLNREVNILKETIIKKISQWIDLWNYWS
jgi:hypothetical protein